MYYFRFMKAKASSHLSESLIIDMEDAADVNTICVYAEKHFSALPYWYFLFVPSFSHKILKFIALLLSHDIYILHSTQDSIDYGCHVI